MTCERYWRDGIVLSERGELDPHRATCPDCRREHAACQELVRAMPRLGSVPGDSQWQARVWRQIAQEGAALGRQPALRSTWQWLCGGLVAACVALLVWVAVGRQTATSGGDGVVASDAVERLPRIEIISGPVAMRSTSARVGDRVRISARPDDEIRVYRADHLLLRCAPKATPMGCVRSARRVVAETTFTVAGDYQLVVIRSVAVDPVGTLAGDLGAVVAANGDYDLTELSIR